MVGTIDTMRYGVRCRVPLACIHDSMVKPWCKIIHTYGLTMLYTLYIIYTYNPLINPHYAYKFAEKFLKKFLFCININILIKLYIILYTNS